MENEIFLPSFLSDGELILISLRDQHNFSNLLNLNAVVK